jgi:hypothetical protein
MGSQFCSANIFIGTPSSGANFEVQIFLSLLLQGSKFCRANVFIDILCRGANLAVKMFLSQLLPGELTLQFICFYRYSLHGS